MQCEICHKATATVHLTDVSNNLKKEIHLCEGCAKERGTTIKSHMNAPTSEEMPDIKAANLISTDLGESDTEEDELVCPNCGISYRKFRSSGKFGCPQDYEVFGGHVIQLLEKIHHKVQHVGKVPSGAKDSLAVEQELQSLRDSLQEAIAAEEYERAAQIRDKIYSLEGQLKP